MDGMSFAGEGSRSAAGSHMNTRHSPTQLISDDTAEPFGDSDAGPSRHMLDNKPGFLDWSTEAPGQRVAYDDLTAIGALNLVTASRRMELLTLDAYRLDSRVYD
ncbi:hypothetical protein TWF788_009926 [Orbilia oligospora]|uniref:Uncharacterized protein n=1 Tax=Orbilia oligospora TaxID=2813651 RepID=A0A6G1M0K8_ORBOL|nr:hypothetical protein TWF788_009926 [Orbilia oligospora]KAF3211763.1 hypothetical protein TWF679_006256 [Orbilia oligospora]KAF3221918.1 hypothetical protein TWF191_006966 [Orbilia oligospora]KAF3240037.1 hypothetical protein TWF192_009575 [Orbilia oligospora]